MKRLVLFTLLAVHLPATAHALTWSATCTDGKNMQYEQVVGGNGKLFLQGSGGTLNAIVEIAPLKQESVTKDEICSYAVGMAPKGTPVTRICINFVTKSINLKYWNPTMPQLGVQDAGKYCAASVTSK